MSADNWAICPRCLDNARRTADEAKVEVMGLYGVVPPEEFEQRRDALTDPNPEDFRTFREDYEFYGADEGEIQVDYSGVCSKCHLRVELGASKRFWPDSAASRKERNS